MSKELKAVYKKLPGSNYLETPISDSTRSINYSDNDQILEIEFRPNFIYQYLDVPASVWTNSVWTNYKKAIEDGRSSGKFIHENGIRENYDYRKVLLNQFAE